MLFSNPPSASWVHGWRFVLRNGDWKGWGLESKVAWLKGKHGWATHFEVQLVIKLVKPWSWVFQSCILLTSQSSWFTLLWKPQKRPPPPPMDRWLEVLTFWNTGHIRCWTLPKFAMKIRKKRMNHWPTWIHLYWCLARFWTDFWKNGPLFFRKMVHPTFYQSELIVHEIILKTPLALLRRWPWQGQATEELFRYVATTSGIPYHKHCGASINSGQGGWI